MEPPKGFLATLWSFICFLPYFIGLLLLGIIKGIIFCPLICLIMTIGNSAIILGMWPVHCVWTYYCIVRAKQLGPFVKLAFCICMPAVLVLWPAFGIVGGIIGGAGYGFLSPIFATFDAVGEGKTNVFFHCFYVCIKYPSSNNLLFILSSLVALHERDFILLHLQDGTRSTIDGSCTMVRDLRDVCFHSYFSVMDDLRQQDGKYYEIRLPYIPGSIIAGVLGFMVDFPVVSIIALCKSPYMLFKGWHRLFRDLIGRDGPFLETICVPFAGLAILLWPLAVVGAVLGSMVASIFLGAYAGVVVYQESSFWSGLCYIITSLSLYDEYSNDVLGMREGSCFPRPYKGKEAERSRNSSRTSTISRPSSFKNPPSRTASLNNHLIDLNPLELFEIWFKECQRQGEILVSDGIITLQDIEDAKSGTGSRVVSTGLPAYCLLRALIRSAKANSQGILLSNDTEITTTNRPKDTYFDWFLNPFLIIKDQIKAENLTDAEEDYLQKLVLLCGDPERLKNTNIGAPPESERKRAELDALARRLQGITKSISRFPTGRRHFESLLETLSEDLAKKNGGYSSSEPQAIQRSKSAFARIFSQKSFQKKTSHNGSDQESQSVVVRDIDIA